MRSAKPGRLYGCHASLKEGTVEMKVPKIAANYLRAFVNHGKNFPICVVLMVQSMRFRSRSHRLM